MTLFNIFFAFPATRGTQTRGLTTQIKPLALCMRAGGKPPTSRGRGRVVAVRTTFNAARKEFLAAQHAQAAVSSDSSDTNSDESCASSRDDSSSEEDAPLAPRKHAFKDFSDEEASDTGVGGGNDYFTLQRRAGKASAATLADVAFPADSELSALLDKVKTPHAKEMDALKTAHADRYAQPAGNLLSAVLQARVRSVYVLEETIQWGLLGMHQILYLGSTMA